MSRLTAWLPKSLQSQFTRQAAPRRRARLLRVVELEDRLVPANFNVTNLNDSGTGSLRDAVALANVDGVADTVTFTLAGTVNLTTTEIAINNPVTITGHSGGTTISGGGGRRIFNTFFAPPVAIGFEKLTITGGASGVGNDGGAIFANDELLSFTDCTISNSTAGAEGGGIFFSTVGSLTLLRCNVTGNSATTDGGGVYFFNGGSLNVSASTISNNKSSGVGGVYFFGTVGAGGVNVVNSTISGNSSGSNGGGVYLRNVVGTVTVLNSTLTANTALNGGGIWANSSTLNITNSTLNDNFANGAPGGGNGNGGGLLNTSAANVTISNSTLSNNRANREGGGIQSSSALTVRNATLTDNTARADNGLLGNGGGLSVLSGTSTLFNTIVAGNFVQLGIAAADIQGTNVSAGSLNNLVGDTASAGGLVNGVNGNLVGNSGAGTINIASVLNTVLASNGGPTKTHALVTNSPAINAGNNAQTGGAVNDQRGIARNAGGVDIGAFELNTLVTNTNDSGVGSLRDAVAEANRVGGTDVIKFDASFAAPQTIKLTTGELAFNFFTGPGNSVTIAGPGAGLLTISGNNASRIFNTNLGAPTDVYTFNDLTLTAGSATDGGAVFVGDEIAQFNNVNITNCKAGGTGGAIRFTNFPSSLTMTNCAVTGNSAALIGAVAAGAATLTDCTFTGNKATFNFGAIYALSLTVNRTTISGNSAGSAAGGAYSGSFLLIENSTVSGNIAPFGGGLVLGKGAGPFTVRNSTLANNSSTFGAGGAVDLGFSAAKSFVGTLNIQNTTITGNSAATAGGGISRSYGTGSITIDSSIVSGNSAASNVDISTSGSATVNFSAIGSGTGFTLVGSNNRPFGENLKLGSLAANGGPTQSILPAIDSPLRDGGNNLSGLTTDQRGPGFPRAWNVLPDIGAVELDPNFLVTNTNDAGVGSLRQQVLDANAFAGNNTITFDSSFNSVKTITLTSGELALTQGVTIMGKGANLTTISGNNASRIFNTSSGPEGEPYAFSGLTLTAGKSGAGADGGAILADSENLSITDCTISNSSAGEEGGAIYMHAFGSLTLTRSTVTGNTAGTSGGGIYFFNGGSLNIVSSTISNNKAFITGGGFYFFGSVFPGGVNVINSTISSNSASDNGGAAYLKSIIGTINVQNSTLTGNTALNGGGIWFDSGTLNITNSTLSDNFANGASSIGHGNGGGLLNTSTTTVVISNSTFSNNRANREGGGIQSSSTLTLRNATLTDNTARADGGALGSGGGLSVLAGTSTLFNTIVAGNFVQLGASPSDIQGVAVAGGSKNNLIGDVGTSGGLTNGVNGNIVGVAVATVLNPTLANNGGPTLTHALVSPGPAVNKGLDSETGGATTDQRGAPFTRTSGTVDIGAYEVQTLNLTVNNTGDVSDGDYSAGKLTLREALQLTNNNPGADSIGFSALFNTAQTITLTGGELALNDAVTITGKGANLTTISGNNASRIFNTTLPGPTAFNFNSLTLTGGVAGAVGGAVVLAGDEQLTFTNCVISGNSASGDGGFINFIEPNLGKLTLDGCSVTGNTGANGGGIAVNQGANSILVLNSTIANNKSPGQGGGFRLLNFPAGSTVTVRNSTIAGNSAKDGGGLRPQTFSGALVIQNCTITGNTASVNGGGINAFGGVGTIAIESTILSGNLDLSGSTSPDVENNSLPFSYKTSAIGSASGLTAPNDLGGNLVIGANLKLGQLADNGGPTLTVLPAADSALVNNGSNPAALLTDQRGFSRLVSAGVDIGAVELQATNNVLGLVVNDGAVQRSRISKVVVVFASPVDAATLGAISFTRTTPNDSVTVTAANGLIVTPTTGTVSSITLTFQNIDNAGLDFGSLADGRWRLSLPGLGYQSPLNDPTLRRLYGDNNGDGTVDGTDLSAFGAAFGTSVPNSPFDFNADGTVDALDFGEFGNRFGLTL